jgi:hypothetical protein
MDNEKGGETLHLLAIAKNEGFPRAYQSFQYSSHSTFPVGQTSGRLTRVRFQYRRFRHRQSLPWRRLQKSFTCRLLTSILSPTSRASGLSLKLKLLTGLSALCCLLKLSRQCWVVLSYARASQQPPPRRGLPRQSRDVHTECSWRVGEGLSACP